MSEHYILPGELAALIVFVFLPPLLLALLAQVVLLRGRLARTAFAFLTTAVSSVVIGTVLLLFASPGLPAWLGMRDVHLAGGLWPVLPLAFVIVGLVAPIATVVISRHEGSA